MAMNRMKEFICKPYIRYVFSIYNIENLTTEEQKTTQFKKMGKGFE